MQSRHHGVGSKRVSQRGQKRNAVVRGELEYRSGRLDVRVRSDVRVLAVPILKAI